MHQILIFNLGGTSTKLALFEDESLKAEGTIRHTDEEIAACTDNSKQIAFRKEKILGWLQESNISLDGIDAVVMRSFGAGVCKKGGTYQVTGMLRDKMYEIYQASFPLAAHPSAFVVALVEEVIAGHDIPIYIVDPDGVDEFEEVARVTGYPEFRRNSGYHVLNHKAMARKAAKDMGKAYEDVNLVVAHMGGGTSIAAHKHGLVVEATSGGSAGVGPFGSNRTGPLPLNRVVDMCFDGKHTKKDVMNIIQTGGGFLALTGYTDLRIIEQKAAEGDANCDLAVEAYIYQVSRYIAAQCAVLCCDVDGIVLTGGMAYSKRVVEGIRRRIGKLAPVLPYPGEEENEAMVAGVLSVLNGEREAIIL